MLMLSLGVRLRVVRPASVLTFAIVFSVASPFARAATCEGLAQLKLANTTITLARAETPDTFKPIENGTPGAPLVHLPSFCRVAGTISPTADSAIKFEVWMPTSNWNRKLMAVGNGGFSGGIWYHFMGGALREGYATTSTDTGHEGSDSDGSFALGHPEKVIDFGYRAVHETTVKAKAIVAAFYDQPIARSYWDGCSSGGKQGLMEAQRFPADFDGIIAGAPANHWEHLTASSIWIEQANHTEPDAHLSPDKLKVLHEAVLQACDASDGVKDGVLNDPFACHFDPRTLVCKDSGATSCLTTQQAEAARKIYGGPVNPRSGAQVFPGLERGSELQWEVFGTPLFPIGSSHFKYIIFKDPNWDFRTLNFDVDIAIADKIDGGTIAAIDPNLKAFFSRGGKLILYHGLTDGLIAPQNTINYYNNVVRAVGPAAKSSMRLYLAPGMDHCHGGAGPFDFDMDTVLADWVERDKAPGTIVASHFAAPGAQKPDRTRPLCSYPQVAKYKGTGSTDEASNFVCTRP